MKGITVSRRRDAANSKFKREVYNNLLIHKKTANKHSYENEYK